MKCRLFFVMWFLILGSFNSFSLVGAQSTTPPSQANLQEAVKSVLQEHPEIVLEALEKMPVALIDLVQRASRLKEIKAKEAQRLHELKHPKVPSMDLERPLRGNSEAPITIVEYSDFECPFCRSASSTIKDVLEEFGEDVRFVYKHNPLNFHPMAEPAARYFEAIALQNRDEAWRFHDFVFERQDRLAEGEDVLKTLAASLSIDHRQLERDLYGKVVEDRLKKDREEAERFGFDGTPAFLINGISLVGAQPKEEFVEIIEMVLEGSAETEPLASVAQP